MVTPYLRKYGFVILLFAAVIVFVFVLYFLLRKQLTAMASITGSHSKSAYETIKYRIFVISYRWASAITFEIEKNYFLSKTIQSFSSMGYRIMCSFLRPDCEPIESNFETTIISIVDLISVYMNPSLTQF
jgi:hypothetical protein